MSVPTTVPAASINWGAPSTISADSDVSTTGTLDRAYNFGADSPSVSATTVNGVTFAAFGVSGASVTVGNTTLSSTAAMGGTSETGFAAAPFSGLSAPYQALLANAAFGSAADTLTLTFNGLTVGRTYQVQYWVNDSRGASAGSNRQTILTAGNAVTLEHNFQNADGGTGQFVIGTFVADSTSQTISITGASTGSPGPSPQINGVQLRFSPPGCIPPTTAYVDASWAGTTPGTDPDGGGPATNFGCDSFATIQEGVNGVAAGGMVIVYAGTYDEQVQISKTLTLKGAKAGVDARTRSTADESIINNACGPVQIMANNVVIDGFTIQGATDPDPCYLAGIWTNPGFSGTKGGHQILNNIVQNNVTGIELDSACDANPTLVQFNLIQNNNNPGPGSGNGIQTNFALCNATIDNNKFSGHTSSSVLVIGPPFSAAVASNINVTNNELVGGSSESIAFLAVSDSAITGNRSTGSTSAGTIDLFGANSNISVTSNLLSNGQRGLFVENPYAVPYSVTPNTGITAHLNSFVGNSVAGIEVAADGDSGNLDAENNWWGCNYGAGATGAGCTGTTNAVINNGSGTVDADPWIILAASASPSTIPTGGTSTVTADMTDNSNAADTTGAGFLPQMPVAWSATQGSMSPTSGTITNDTAISTFTSANSNNGTGCATVSGQIACAAITVTTPSFSISDVTQSETNGTTTFTFTVTKTGANAVDAKVKFDTLDGTATTADNDYDVKSGTLTFSPSAADDTQTIDVTVNGDLKYEDTETFTVRLSSPTAATISKMDGTGTITNDDPIPTISIASASAIEGNAVVFTVTQSSPSAFLTTFDYSTADGTAVAPGDYTDATDQPGSIAIGSTTTTISIPTVSDSTYEGNETFTVTLSNPNNAMLGTDTATGTITNDDNPPTSLVVTKTADTNDGFCSPTDCSLREAIQAANFNPDVSTITFNIPGPAPYVISLTLGDTFTEPPDPPTNSELTINTDVVISGPGADSLIVQRGSGSFRVFDIAPGVTVTMSGLTITNGNVTGDDGGGIANEGALNLNSCNVTGNTAGRFGGAFINFGTLTIRDSSITGNHGNTAIGGIYNRSGATLTIVDSTISGNSSETFAGGLINEGGILKMVNSTVSGNTAKTEGGGLYNYVNGTSTLTNVTVTQNRADSDGNGSGVGGGVYRVNGTVTLKNTIVAGNFKGASPGTTADDINGAVNADYSLIGDPTGATITGGNNLNGDPKLQPLQNNGGPTYTHLPQPASPAVDQGAAALDENGNALTKDQRGFTRPVRFDNTRSGAAGGDYSDIGAVELQAAVCTTPPSGLLSWWPGDGNPTDIYSGNNGTLQNGATYGPGEVAQAFSFDGVDDYVEVPDNPVLNPAAVTVDAWIYPTDIGGNHNVVFKGDHEYLLQIRNGNVLFGSRDGGGNYVEFQGSLTVPVNAWSHVAITHDGSTKRIYVNGVLDPVTQNQAGLYTGDTNSLKIGTHYVVQEFFRGLIDEVEIFDHALSDSEISSIYNAGPGGKCKPCTTPPTGMTHWWPGQDHPNDIVGSSHGTLKNGASYGPGRVGRAFSFDGVNDYVDVGDVDLPGTFTIDAWVYPTDLSNYPIIVSKDDGGGSRSYYLNIDVGGTLTATVTNTGGQFTQYRTGAVIVPGTWQHVALTYNGGATTGEKMKFYVNGINAPASVLSGNDFGGNPQNNSLSTKIGIWGDGVGNAFPGLIDEVELFNRVLSGDEVQAIYSAGASGKCVPDATVQFTASDYPVGEADGSVTLTVTRTGDTSGKSKVAYTVTPGTATAVSDYGTATPASPLIFGEGVVSQTIVVPITADSAYEPTESFSVQLGFVDTTIGTPDKATVTITDDDPAPSFSILGVTQPEGDAGTTAFKFKIKKTGETGVDTSIDYETVNDTAVAPGDFTAIAPTTLTFPPGGDTTIEVSVFVKGDTTYEADETFKVHLSNPDPASASITTADGIGTITNDDAKPTFSINDVSHKEGHSGTTQYQFTVTKSGNSTEVDSYVDVKTVDGTAVAPGDYTAVPTTTLHFAPGDTTMPVTVLVKGDTTVEPDETFTVHLSNAVDATIPVSTADGTGTILNDDVSFAISDVTKAEGNSGPTTFTFTVTKSGSIPASVDFATADDTAKMSPPSNDYVFTSGNLDFAAGDATKDISVTVNGDMIYELNETFFVNLSNATSTDTSANASITDGQGVGTITNDDAKPTLTIDNRSNNEGTPPLTTPTPSPLPYTTMTFTVTKGGNSTEVNATVHYATQDGTAIGGTSGCPSSDDYQTLSDTVLTFLPNETTKTITVTVCKDSTYEANETFFVNLTGAQDATPSSLQGQGTILNDDIPSTGFTVNTTDDLDDGVCDATHCSLREAINAANGSTSVVAIKFNIPATDPRHFYYADDSNPSQVTLANVTTTTATDDSTISNIDPQWAHSWWSILPTSPLPAATKQVFIDGYSQTGTVFNTLTTGTNAQLRIEIDGASAGANANGLTISGGTSTVRGLAINRFRRDGTAGTPAGNCLVVASGGNTVSGNFIGTDVSGTLDVGTLASLVTGSGISVTGNNSLIGGATPDVVNLIAGNDQDGITFSNSNTNTIPGNLIGTKKDGTTALGNGLSGLNFSGPGSGFNSVGGTDAGQGNTIAFNGSDGVSLPTAGSGNNIRGNSIYSNGNTSLTLGIDLDVDGVTPNDTPANKDADTGPNGLQNFPVLTSALVTGSTKTIKGTLDSTAGDQFDIDFYANDSCDDSGNGEGKTYLGTVRTAATDSAGHVSFTFHPDANYAIGKFITATATTTTAALSNTSEFSQCLQVANGSAGAGDIQFTSNTYSVGEGSTTAAITVQRVNGSNGVVTAKFSTSDGTATAPADYVAITNSTIMFQEDETGPKTINVTINNDTIDENDETVNLTLTTTLITAPNSIEQAVNPHAAVLTIVDNDPQAAFSINDVTHNEGSGESTDYKFTVTRTGGTSFTTTVDYATVDGTAKADSDYFPATGTLIFPPSAGTVTQTITVSVFGDADVEPNEQFTVHLSNAVNATISDADGVGTINNDDTAAPTPTATATPMATATATATPTVAPSATASPTPREAAPAQNLNISTRLRVETGDKAMIAGFIITGNSDKAVVLRGIGPSLGQPPFNLTGVLLDPILELHGSNNSVITANDNWKDMQRSLIEGGPFQPHDDRESVILATLAPANYTAILTGKDNGTGVGVVEVYDNNQAADSVLGNISTRGFVQTDSNVMIGGFILGSGQNKSRIAIRGIGPSLSNFGLNNVLADPTLELIDANGTRIVANDNWTDDPISAALLISNGLPLSNQKESGIFTALPPGQFTVILAGKDRGVGIGLIEVYNLK